MHSSDLLISCNFTPLQTPLKLSVNKPSLPQGTRDYGPEDTACRNYLFNTLKLVFREFGFMQLETPAMEQLSTLTGKYGDEGDQLLFKILNSGDYISKVPRAELAELSSKQLLPKISERALRYDLTVPFARYVAMNQHAITFPFKRFQIQPVWRADRPQKGRYREFYQCDADCVGSASLINEAELISIYDKALFLLGIKNTTLRLNNRKILAAIAETIGRPADMTTLVTAIDKLDKIGAEGVEKELTEKGFSPAEIAKANLFWALKGSAAEQLSQLKGLFTDSETGLKGVEELETVLMLHAAGPSYGMKTELNLSLARGLNYYTGTIMEVIAEHASGSIGGGGRYDDLTGIFGLKGVTGVGISFGADRIFDLMKELNLFPPASELAVPVLICNFYPPAEVPLYTLTQQLRSMGIAVEFYPDQAKLPKQLKYAHQKHIPHVVLVGEEEFKAGKFLLKTMTSGEQILVNETELLAAIKQINES